MKTICTYNRNLRRTVAAGGKPTCKCILTIRRRLIGVLFRWKVTTKQLYLLKNKNGLQAVKKKNEFKR